MSLDIGATKDPARRSQAVALLQTAIPLDGSLAEPHYRLGNLALTEGKAAEALDERKLPNATREVTRFTMRCRALMAAWALAKRPRAS